VDVCAALSEIRQGPAAYDVAGACRRKNAAKSLRNARW
jgi:hypothetical protein